jgi:hypothetical protein
MARRNANLAGLAALGALGYQLYNQSKGKDKGGAPVEDRVATPVITGDDQYNPDVKYGDIMTEKEPGWESAMAPAGGMATTAAPSKPAATTTKKTSPAMMSREQEAAIRAKGGSRGTRYLPADESVYKKAQEKAASPEGRAERKRQEEAQAIENMSGDFLPVARFGKMLGNAAKSARTALATRAAEETPVTFLGASGRRAVNPDLLPGPSRALATYKKGGAVKAKSEKAEKPAAKGWGKARGVRAAKYY